MKIPTLFQAALLLAALAASSVVQASCQANEPEIGDIGPDSNRVCADLEREFPRANVQIDDQQIHSPTNVVISVQIDSRPLSVEYRLVDADWISMPALSLAGE